MLHSPARVVPAVVSAANLGVAPVSYRISSSDLGGHLFTVALTVVSPDPDGQSFALPAWIPGSYMIREFARHIVRLRAESGGKKISFKKTDKHTWQAAPCAGPLTVHYEVYAWDLSVRAAHLDRSHGFFNSSSVFLRVLGQEQQLHEVDIVRPGDAACAGWRVATALPERNAKRYGFGTYAASGYDELIDHPVEMGEFVLSTFTAHGVPHDIVISGRTPNLDLPRLAQDLKKICEAQIAFFEPRSKRAPMQRYVFMTFVVGNGYGGLEHRASTALICARSDLPVIGKAEMTDGYRTYLGLCSHEYFHTWNVKRIKPAAFAPYDLQNENYTSLLWLFEGFTSYYDDLFLLRSGVIDISAYLSLLGKTVNGVLRGSGRKKQSVAESSFDTWGKYYRQDENAPNAIVSYYTKGSLIALALDLTLRAETGGRSSLDSVMQVLWQRYGREFYSPAGGRGLGENEIEALIEEVSGCRMKRFFDRYVRGTEDLPLDSLLAQVGIAYSDTRKIAVPGLGVRLSNDHGESRVASVYEGGAGHRAGLSADDRLVALDGLRIPGSGPDGLLERYRPGDSVTLHVFRRDELLELRVRLRADDAPQVKLSLAEKPPAAANIFLR
ncbi:PDZ domain-containing protein [Herbaspirillum sp. RTI4]|uniref:M61 family metallopeptidase n=1 Tax=Herbaspirillum sp. RTI4 TaxID=3048640 RepID=UPI002AB44C4A|nr:PDZ domain-containing protein [Herbaspirillum sp. RTI4]MDY7577846.1 PDZ domain-containing protein [Herbaspirillum sp. RTI4]MEA9982464.1 PDZ domain-containing protein [Herbaspirillum sp. RTI4]